LASCRSLRRFGRLRRSTLAGHKGLAACAASGLSSASWLSTAAMQAAFGVNLALLAERDAELVRCDAEAADAAAASARTQQRAAELEAALAGVRRNAPAPCAAPVHTHPAMGSSFPPPSMFFRTNVTPVENSLAAWQQSADMLPHATVSCVRAEARDAHACAAAAADARDAHCQARLGRMRAERQEAAGRQAALEVSLGPLPPSCLRTARTAWHQHCHRCCHQRKPICMQTSSEAL